MHVRFSALLSLTALCCQIVLHCWPVLSDSFRCSETCSFTFSFLFAHRRRSGEFALLFYLCVGLLGFNLLSPNSRSNANFSFQFIASCVCYSMENLAGDLLLGLKVCITTNSPNTVHTFCSGQVGRIKVRIFGV